MSHHRFVFWFTIVINCYVICALLTWLTSCLGSSSFKHSHLATRPWYSTTTHIIYIYIFVIFKPICLIFRIIPGKFNSSNASRYEFNSFQDRVYNSKDSYLKLMEKYIYDPFRSPKHYPYFPRTHPYFRICKFLTSKNVRINKKYSLQTIK